MSVIHPLEGVHNLADFIKKFNMALLVTEDDKPRTIVCDTSEVSWVNRGTSMREGVQTRTWECTWTHTANVVTVALDVALFDKETGHLMKTFSISKRTGMPGDRFFMTYTLTLDRRIVDSLSRKDA